MIAGTDIHTGHVSGVMTGHRLDAMVTDPQDCLDSDLTKPAEEEVCLEGPCPQWVVDEWTEVRFCELIIVLLL